MLGFSKTLGLITLAHTIFTKCGQNTCSESTSFSNSSSTPDVKPHENLCGMDLCRTVKICDQMSFKWQYLKPGVMPIHVDIPKKDYSKYGIRVTKECGNYTASVTRRPENIMKNYELYLVVENKLHNKQLHKPVKQTAFVFRAKKSRSVTGKYFNADFMYKFPAHVSKQTIELSYVLPVDAKVIKPVMVPVATPYTKEEGNNMEEIKPATPAVVNNVIVDIRSYAFKDKGILEAPIKQHSVFDLKKLACLPKCIKNCLCNITSSVCCEPSIVDFDKLCEFITVHKPRCDFVECEKPKPVECEKPIVCQNENPIGGICTLARIHQIAQCQPAAMPAVCQVAETFVRRCENIPREKLCKPKVCIINALICILCDRVNGNSVCDAEVIKTICDLYPLESKEYIMEQVAIALDKCDEIKQLLGEHIEVLPCDEVRPELYEEMIEKSEKVKKTKTPVSKKSKAQPKPKKSQALKYVGITVAAGVTVVALVYGATYFI